MLDKSSRLAEHDHRKIEHKVRFSFFKKSILGYLIVVLIIISFGMGVIVGKKKSEVKIVSSGASAEFGELRGKGGAVPEYLSKDVNFKIFWDVWNMIQQKYIDRPAGETALFYGALEGMVSSLNDPFSTFFEPKTANDFSEELHGRFEGIGAEIGIRNDVLTVISPLVGSPAERAGLLARDVIVEINGEDTKNMNLYEAVSKIRGERGTTVKLKIYRSKIEDFLEVDIVRDTIKIVSVEFKMFDKNDFNNVQGKKIAYLKVTHFNADTSERFQKAAQQALLNNPDGIILDLRGNPGGFLDAAVDMADYWLAKGEVAVIEQYAGDEKKLHKASREATLNNFKTVVLVNGGSASGSEIVAGALQDHGLATLIGETTFGKGSVQELENLEDGSALKLTIARWLTPSGRTIDKQGIEPNIKVERTVEDYNNDLDPQLDAAVEYIAK